MKAKIKNFFGLKKNVLILSSALACAILITSLTVYFVRRSKNTVDVVEDTNNETLAVDYVEIESTTVEETTESTTVTTEPAQTGFNDVDEEVEETTKKKPNKKPTQSQVTVNVSSQGVNGNAFLNALGYLGYDVTEFTNAGRYGRSVAAAQRTKIKYNSGGATGFETTKDGKPDINAFKKNGLCCASYVGYVYFNYLPNVHGLDMSSLKIPSYPRSAADWKSTCEKWVKDNAAVKYNIKQSTKSSLSKLNNVPIGSILVFTSPNGSVAHVGIYAGMKNGKHFQTHLGSSRGAEVLTVEGIQRNGAYLTLSAAYTPKVFENLYVGAVGVKVCDDAGTAITGVKVGVYSDSACKQKLVEITTDKTGNAVYGYNNGKYSVKAGTTLYFKLIELSDNYDLNTTVYSAKASHKKITYADKNVVCDRKGKITLSVSDNDGTLGQGYIFGVYSDESCTDLLSTLTTNENGKATSSLLTSGTYYVKMIKLSSNDETHLLNETVFKVALKKGETAVVNGDVILLESIAEETTTVAETEITEPQTQLD